jgi:hypothetical protein
MLAAAGAAVPQTLVVNATPWGSVYVDGGSSAHAATNRTAPGRRHRLRIVREASSRGSVVQVRLATPSHHGHRPRSHPAVIRTGGARWSWHFTVAHAPGPGPGFADCLGVRAYRNLEFDVAAGFFTRALTLLGVADTTRRTEALTYLGATEVYRQHADTAHAIFRRVVRLAPAHRIDRLIFPPEVTSVFDAARRATPAVAARLDREQRFRTGDGGFSAVLYGSTFHQIRVELQRSDASPVRTLYAGPIADSVPTVWDGRATDGAVVPSGRYQLAIASLDSGGTTVRILRFARGRDHPPGYDAASPVAGSWAAPQTEDDHRRLRVLLGACWWASP